VNATPRVVVLGGYGHFGTRIARALARHGGAQIWIAGRDRTRAADLACELAHAWPDAGTRAAALDVSDRASLTAGLKSIGADVAIHTAGPFQSRDYTVAEACLDAGCHYLDLADGREFVAGFDRLDQRARSRELLLVTGASTLPGLSSAVVDLLRSRMTTIRSIETSIVPAGQTPPGPATIAAVLSYCGKPVRMLENGVWTARYGWQDVRRRRYPKFTRHVAVCDVPDLELFPGHYGVTGTVSFRAGPELLLEHLALRGMAWLTRLGLVSDWSRHAELFARLGRRFQRFGSATGGMQVCVTGADRDGEAIERRWDLVAASNHGPEIPCMPAIALTKKLIAGELAVRGAMPCIGLISLADFALEAQHLDINWTLTRLDEPCRAST
jgi:uncharacterized protein YbjT (DUF2867 family)